VSEVVARGCLARAYASWKDLFVFARRIAHMQRGFEKARNKDMWLRWRAAQTQLRVFAHMAQRAAHFHSVRSRRVAITHWASSTHSAVRERARIGRAKASRTQMTPSKLRRAMVAWRGLARAHRAQQLKLISLRAHTVTRNVRRNFHAWFLAMQRVRLRQLADSNTLLNHDLQLLHSKLKILSTENTVIQTSLQERVYADVDMKEQEMEYEKKEVAYQVNLKNELALREKLKQYEQRSVEERIRCV
jgi:hypothetical protein